MKDLATRVERWLAPRAMMPAATAVTAEWLTKRSLGNVILDLDNTLLPWRARSVMSDVEAWVQSLRTAGIGLCVASNTRTLRRLSSICEPLTIPGVHRAGKPGVGGIRKALDILGATPERTAMIGDQLLTDVVAGNRLGLFTVLVPRLSRWEFPGTYVNRAFERALLAWLLRRGVMP